MRGKINVNFVKLRQIKFRKQAKPLKSSGKEIVFLTNLDQTFKRTATDSDTQPTTTQQTLT